VPTSQTLSIRKVARSACEGGFTAHARGREASYFLTGAMGSEEAAFLNAGVLYAFFISDASCVGIRRTV
jgi:hypothetical protein